jgi:hypothetical protein
MGLDANALKKELLAMFRSMSGGDDAAFANGIGDKTSGYAESGNISTKDAGAIPAGVFTGTGSGGITTTASICANIVKAACDAMRNMAAGGNAYFAECLAAAIETMINSGVVETDVSGIAVPPSGGPSPVSGKAKGVMTGTTKAVMQAAFLSAFTAMNDMTEDGDEYMAEQMAAAITAYYKAAMVTTAGQAALAGDVGSGSMV